MSPTYEELRKMTLAELREVAKGIEHEAVQGYTQMHKDQLLKAVCTALGIDTREHHRAVGIDKTAIKRRIRELKSERQAAIEAKDYERLARVRREIHRLKRRLRAAMV